MKPSLSVAGLRWLFIFAMSAGLSVARAQVTNSHTNFFAGAITLDGDISDFFLPDGVTPKPGVCLIDDPNGLEEPPVAAGAARDVTLHPSGFNQRRVFAAFNPNLNGGTLFVGIDLPGGTGANNASRTTHSFPGNPNPNYFDGVVGAVVPGFGRGKILPFDADANGEADLIGRTAGGGNLVRCGDVMPGDTPDILACGTSAAMGATDNPRSVAGEVIGARENYVVNVMFANGQTVMVELFENTGTPAGVAQAQMASSPVAPFGFQFSTTTGGTGTPLGFDVEVAITNINAAVPDFCARQRFMMVVDSGSNRDGSAQGEDQNLLECQYIVPPAIEVTKRCSGIAAVPGGPLIFTGSVRNTGPMTLTNVTVVNDQPVPNTLVFGPTNIPAGVTLNFTNSYLVPTNFTNCSIMDTLTARGFSACDGVSVSDTDTAACPVGTTLTLLCPTNRAVQCFADIPPPNTNSVTVISSSGGTFVQFVGDVLVTNGCIITNTRTYKVTDACTNMAFCTQVIVVQDTIPPVLLGVPPDTNVQCFADVPPAVVTAMDNCGTNIMLSAISGIAIDGCAMIISRCWTAMDSCSNATSRCQTVTIRDTIPPVLIGVPRGTNVQCLSDLPPLPLVTATDNCDTNVAISRISTTNGICPTIIIHTWTATDDCTNITRVSVTNTVNDTIPPVLIGVPGNTNFQCLADVPPPAVVTATDNCDGIIPVTTTYVTNGLCPTIITCTWRAQDRCTNSASATRTITVNDTIPPVLVGVPGNTNFQCLSDVPPPAVVTATDNCDGIIPVTTTYVTNGLCPMIITCTWRAQDRCTNSASATRTITVNDTIPPVLVGVPGNTNFLCLSDVPPPANVTATDNCDGTIPVTRTVTTNGLCPIIITYMWRAQDRCTNSATATRTVTVIDTLPPVLAGVPTNQTYQCPSDVPPPANVTATDNCDGVLPVTTTYTTNGLCPTIITCMWRAQDRCTNIVTATRTITINDTIPPVLVGLPANTNFQCLGDVPSLANVTATDNCDGIIPVTAIYTTNGTCPMLITCVWRAQDRCTNTVTATRFITINDTTPPVLTGVPTNLSFQCVADIPNVNVSASDNCDGIVPVTLVCTTNGTCPILITCTWRAQDRCTNTTAITRVFTVRDTLPPTIFCPANLNVQCLTNVPPCPTTLAQFRAVGGAALDNCDSNLTYVCTDGPLIGGICGGTIARTHTVFDDCTNAASCVQIIIVRDTTPPVITCPPDITVQCLTNVPPCPTTLAQFLALGGTARDNCDSNLTYTCTDGPLIGGICGGRIARTHTVTDDCTNLASCVQLITINDTIPPVITCPTNRTVQCTNDIPPCPTTLAQFLALGGTARDNCDSNLTYRCVDSPPTSPCGGQVVRTHTVIDDCTNSASCVQIFTVRDTMPPVLVGVPPDAMYDCMGDVPLPPQVTAVDNCCTNITVMFFTSTSGNCPTTITRTWMATDICSNMVMGSQRIWVFEDPPTIVRGLTNLSFCDPTNLTLCVQVSTTCPVTYQWQKDGVNIPGATNVCYTITNAQPTDVGEYCVIITGPCGQLRSCARVSGCAPCLDVVKEIACALPANQCGPFGKVAIGYKSGTSYPAFCYRITVFNCGGHNLTNVTVIDDKLGNLTTQFFPTPNTVLPVGGSVSRTFRATLSNDTVNTVIVGGKSATSGQMLTNNDSATGVVRTASMVCQTLVTSPCDQDGNPNDNHVTLSNGAPCAVTFTTILCNNGQVDLAQINVTLPGLASLGCVSAFGIPSLPVGACYTNSCTVTMNCSNAPVINIVTAVGQVDIRSGACGHDLNGSNITVRTMCESRVECFVEPCLRIIKTVSPTHVPPFGQATYSYTVINCGGVTLTNVVVIDDGGTPNIPGDDVTVGTIPVFPPGAVTNFTQTLIPPVTICATNTMTASGLIIIQFLPNGNIKASFVQAFDVNDNTYGVNSYGWGGPNGHKFSNLTGSDHVRWLFKNGNGQSVLSFDQDYISATNVSAAFPAGYASLGLGGDGGFISGNQANLLGFSSSLAENLNKQPFLGSLAQYIVDSPASNNVNAAQWEYRMIYTVIINSAAFGASGFGSASIIDQHNSPGKRRVDNPTPCDLCVTNIATVTGRAGLVVVTNRDDAVICRDQPPPGLTLTKSASPTETLPGGMVIYTYTVCNVGQTTLSNIVVRDDNATPGVPADDFVVGTVALLLPGQCTNLSATVTIPNVLCPDDPVVPDDDGMSSSSMSTAGKMSTGSSSKASTDKSSSKDSTDKSSSAGKSSDKSSSSGNSSSSGSPGTSPRSCCLTNIAVATAQTGSDTLNASARAVVCVTNPPPGLILSKVPDSLVVTPGGQATYTYMVCNVGMLVLSNVVVRDDNGTPGFAGDDFVVGTIPVLVPGGCSTLRVTVMLPSTLCGPDTNGVMFKVGQVIPQVLPNGDVKVTFIQDFAVNDNTYGTNSIGWGNKTHTFGNLTGSDSARFAFTNGAGQRVFEFDMDYISASGSFPAGYGSLGLGGDGGLIFGTGSWLLSAVSSLQENLNKQPFLSNLVRYTVNSPALSDPNSGFWEYNMIYTVIVSRNAFGASGFGNVGITRQHNSPAKQGATNMIPSRCLECITNVAVVTAQTGGRTVRSIASAVVCGNTNPAPCLRVAKFCPPTPVVVGVPLVYSGWVSNCGGTTLSNVFVVNDQPQVGTPVLGPLVLAPGQAMAFTGSYPVTGCAPAVDRVTAMGIDLMSGTVVSNSATASCPVVFSSCIFVSKSCPPSPVLQGGILNYTGFVSNCGNVILTNVVVVNNRPVPNTLVLGPISLAPGQSVPFANNYSVPNVPGPYVDTVTASGRNVCNGQTVTNSATASCPSTTVPPEICVTKEIACLLPGNECTPFGKVATGVKSLLQDPAFCYRITISNCGPSRLTNVVVVDDKLPGITTNFPNSLAVGQAVTLFFKMAWGTNTTNTVTVSGRNATSGLVTFNQDSAVALVKRASAVCEALVTSTCDQDGNPNDNHVSLPSNGAPCAVHFTITVCNNGDVPLANVRVVCPALANLCFGSDTTVFPLIPVGVCVSKDCTVLLTCTNLPIINDVTVTGQVSTNSGFCAYDFNGSNVTVRTTCRSVVECVARPPGLRVFKSADHTTVPEGGLVTYSYVVTNTGGLNLANVTVTDDNGTPGFPGDDFVVGVVANLPVGGSATFTRTVTLPVRLCNDTTGQESGLLVSEVLSNGNIRAVFIQSTSVNDNTYGVNSIGWGNKTHTFGNLTGSDQAQFQFRNGAGQVVLEFKLDYISSASTALYPAGYGTLGVTGGDGGLITGSAASVLAYSTSLTENLNKPPFLNNLAQYTVNSPALADPNSALWEYRMIYSVIVAGNAFGASGFGGVMISDQHNSPSKVGNFTPVICGGCVTNVATARAVFGTNVLTSSAAAVVCTTNRTQTAGECPKKNDYWKKNTAQWPATYSPNQTVVSVFDKASLYANAASKTLVEALDGKAGSGKVKDLLKQAVAAVLNASTPGIAYPFTSAEVITGVNMALMNGSDDALKALTDLLKEANENNDCNSTSSGGENCDTAGKPNVLTLQYNGQSCALATNAQMAISGKTSCSGDPAGALTVRIIATDSSSPPTASSARFFDGLVTLGQNFDVRAANAGDDRFGSNTYLYIYNGATLVQTIQIHTSCSAPLRRGDTFGALRLIDYKIE